MGTNMRLDIPRPHIASGPVCPLRTAARAGPVVAKDSTSAADAPASSQPNGRSGRRRIRNAPATP